MGFEEIRNYFADEGVKGYFITLGAIVAVVIVFAAMLASPQWLPWICERIFPV